MPDDDSPQNVYDDPAFLAGYATLERFGTPWGTAYEHAAFDALLPDPTDLRVLDLGCGTGQLSVHLAEAGAAEVIGLDVSERMLALAQERNAHSRVTYQQAPMETAAFPPERFDLVVSSLAIHYVSDYAGLVARIATWLAPGGILVYSTEHPIVTARASDEGWIRDTEGTRRAWAIARYSDEGPFEEHWFREGVRKVHRMVSTLLNVLVELGLVIERVEEPMPTEAMLRDHPDWIHERKRPPFLLVRAAKPSAR